MLLFIESFGFGINGIPLMTDRSINDRRKCLACERDAPRSRMTRHSFSSRFNLLIVRAIRFLFVFIDFLISILNMPSSVDFTLHDIEESQKESRC